jgi:hypothetical protein
MNIAKPHPRIKAFGRSDFDISDTYPHYPGFKVSGPSEDTAKAVAPIAATLREQVLNAIARAGSSGGTADEIAHDVDRSILSVRPRVSELHREGMIRPSGARGRNASGMTATIWVLAVNSTDVCQGGER